MKRWMTVAALAVGLAPAAAEAVTIPVTTTANGSVAGACTLRDALLSANNDVATQACPAGSAADEITLPAGTFALGGTQLELYIDEATITGAGADVTVIDAQQQSRALRATGPAVTLRDLSIRGGRVTDNPGAGVYSMGPLTLDGVVMTDNRILNGGNPVTRSGGAVNAQSVVATDSTFTDNRAGDAPDPDRQGGRGGAIAAGAVDVTASRFEDNAAGDATSIGGDGGAILASGRLRIDGSTFAGNAGGAGSIPAFGGAVSWSASNATVDAEVTDSTFTGNTGGALHVFARDGSIAVRRSTFSVGDGTTGSAVRVSGNTGTVSAELEDVTIDAPDSTSASAVWLSAASAVLRSTTVDGQGLAAGSDGDAFTLERSIVRAPDACNTIAAYAVAADSVVFPADGDCAGATAGDPRLGPLQDNGGLAGTMLPGAGSAAINLAGPGCPATDVRGVGRPQGPACDAGPVEVLAPTSSPLTVGAVTANTAALTGSVDPREIDGAFRIAFGPVGGALAQSAPTAVDGAGPVGAKLTGLMPATTYRASLVAVTTVGETTGPEVTFTTGPAPPEPSPSPSPSASPAPTAVAARLKSRSATISKRRRLRLAVTCGTPGSGRVAVVAKVRGKRVRVGRGRFTCVAEGATVRTTVRVPKRAVRRLRRAKRRFAVTATVTVATSLGTTRTTGKAKVRRRG